MIDKPFELSKFFRYEQHGSDSIEETENKSSLNQKNFTILGRSQRHWLIFVCYYSLFYSGVICYWYLCYLVFQRTLKEETPKWFLTQPGFSFEPVLALEKSYATIEYDEELVTDVEKIKKHINTALAKYGQVPEGYFGDCQHIKHYGYRDNKPCFFLKFNRIIGFRTQAIESLRDLPVNAPQELRLYIKQLSPEERLNRIWVSCESRPRLSFVFMPQRYYVISNIDPLPKELSNNLPFGCRKPNSQRFFNESDFRRIIAVQVKKVPVNVQHQVRCIVWAKNIQRDTKGRMGRGLVRFKLKIKI